MPLRKLLRLSIIRFVTAILILGGYLWQTSRHPAPVITTLKMSGEVNNPLAFAPDNSLLITAGTPGHYAHIIVLANPDNLRAYEFPSGRLRFSTADKFDVSAVAFSPDGRYLAFEDTGLGNIPVSGFNPWIHVLRASDGALIHRINTKNATHLLAFPNANTLQSVELDAGVSGLELPFPGWTLRSWDLKTLAERPKRHVDQPISNPFASSSAARLLAVDGPNLQGVLLLDIDGRLPAIHLSNQPSHVPILTGETTTSTLSQGISFKNISVCKATFSDDGRRIAIGRSGPSVEIWDIPSRRLLADHKVHGPQFLISSIKLPGRGETFYEVADKKRTFYPDTPILDDLSMWAENNLSRYQTRNESLAWDVAVPRPRFRETNGVPLVISPDATLGAWSPDHGKTIEILDLRLNHP